jgi:hypothetical protein
MSQAKSAAPYVVGAAKLSLKTLQSLSDAIPWIKSAIGFAIQVIETAEVSRRRFIICYENGAQGAR